MGMDVSRQKSTRLGGFCCAGYCQVGVPQCDPIPMEALP
jgi:hypothetical protein